MFFAVSAGFVALAVLLLLVWLRRRLGSCSLKHGEHVALIIAHPDDECMFFAPAILELSKRKSLVHILCLSRGNFYGKGSIRQQELQISATLFGICMSRVEVVNDRELHDNPHVKWSTEVIEKHVVKFIKRHRIDTVITFDENGVSGHQNHTAIAKAIRELHQREVLRKAGVTEVLLLDTLHTLRKYTSWLDVIYTLACRKPQWYACVDLSGCNKAKEAMLAYASQMAWFRRLYLIFSRYMIINTFTRLPSPPNQPASEQQ